MKLRKYFKNLIDNKYPGWDITIALRYIPIVDDLKRVQKSDQTILEVGSEITGITPYLKRKVTGVDINFDYSKKNEYLTPIKIKGVELPFKDSSFDYVLSVDMLEHVPPKLREKAISEMVRVAKKKLYLTFPCGEQSSKVDLELREYYKKIHGQDYPYLKEHTELGLPDLEMVKKLLQPYGKLTINGNTNIGLWKTLLSWGLSEDRLKASFYRRALLLLPILKHFNFGTTYRQLFILEKNS